MRSGDTFITLQTNISDTRAATRLNGFTLKLGAGAARVTDAARTTLVVVTCVVFRFS